MDDFKDDEIKAMTQLSTGIAEAIKQAIDNGMAKEIAIHIAGNVALRCMKKIPNTDEGTAAVQNFVMQVAELLGQLEATTSNGNVAERDAFHRSRSEAQVLIAPKCFNQRT